VAGKAAPTQVSYITSEVERFLTEWKTNKDGVIQTHHSGLTKQLNKLRNMINKLDHNYLVTHLYINDPDHTKLDLNDTDPQQFYISVIAQDNLDQYMANCDKMKTAIKASFQTLVGLLKSHSSVSNKLLIDFLYQKIWARYYRQYVWPFANVVYGYAMTTHSSQGSTYETTFVNVGNILGCRKVTPIVKSKSLYTAVTRASQSVNLLYSHPSIMPLIPDDHKYRCECCRQEQPATAFPPNNCTTDLMCANQLLGKVTPMTIYPHGETIIFADKNKNMYSIPAKELPDQHLNDIYSYLGEHHLIKKEIDRYQQSNLLLIKSL
jgi:hypothetical protein